jgi:hypothetical protein
MSDNSKSRQDWLTDEYVRCVDKLINANLSKEKAEDVALAILNFSVMYHPEG